MTPNQDLFDTLCEVCGVTSTSKLGMFCSGGDWLCEDHAPPITDILEQLYERLEETPDAKERAELALEIKSLEEMYRARGDVTDTTHR